MNVNDLEAATEYYDNLLKGNLIHQKIERVYETKYGKEISDKQLNQLIAKFVTSRISEDEFLNSI